VRVSSETIWRIYIVMKMMFHFAAAYYTGVFC